jgi:hypothetical protein
MKRTKPYPAWVCNDCGVKYGAWYQGGSYSGPKNHCSTCHYDSCDVCGKNDVVVTEPRDYGHLVSGWDTRNQEEAPTLNKTVASVPPVSDTKIG